MTENIGDRNFGEVYAFKRVIVDYDEFAVALEVDHSDVPGIFNVRISDFSNAQ
jgi:hypothetical protein